MLWFLDQMLLKSGNVMQIVSRGNISLFSKTNCTVIPSLVMHKGQVMSKYYRLMNKSGGYTWIQSCVTLINNTTSTSTSNTSNGSNSTNGTSTSKSPNASSSGGNNSTQTSGSEEIEQCIICINYLIR